MLIPIRAFAKAVCRKFKLLIVHHAMLRLKRCKAMLTSFIIAICANLIFRS